MSKKGENKKLKALNAPKSMRISRKTTKWTIKTKAGAHKVKDSVSIGIVLRDYLKVADTLKEAKELLRNKKIKINGKVRKDYQYSIGIFDIIQIEENKVAYRAIFDAKRRIRLTPLEDKLEGKISKVEFKRATKHGVQLTTNDGLVFFNDKAKVGDSLKITMDGKLDSIISLKEGSLVYITKGSHCSEKGIIEEIVSGSEKREKLVKIKQDEKTFSTIAKNIIVIGEKDAAIADMNKL